MTEECKGAQRLFVCMYACMYVCMYIYIQWQSTYKTARSVRACGIPQRESMPSLFLLFMPSRPSSQSPLSLMQRSLVWFVRFSSRPFGQRSRCEYFALKSGSQRRIRPGTTKIYKIFYITKNILCIALASVSSSPSALSTSADVKPVRRQAQNLDFLCVFSIRLAVFVSRCAHSRNCSLDIGDCALDYRAVLARRELSTVAWAVGDLYGVAR